MNWSLFLSTFALIFVAELPDKTAFATVILAARGRALAVFVGAALAFLVQTIVATLFGRVLALAPAQWVHLGTGLLFLVFAFQTFRTRDDDEEDGEADGSHSRLGGFWTATWKSFLVIFIAEWGDLTQIATASLIAKYHEDAVTVFIAAVAALWAVTLLAVLVGQKLGQLISPRRLKLISSVVFVMIGIYFIATWAR